MIPAPDLRGKHAGEVKTALAEYSGDCSIEAVNPQGCVLSMKQFEALAKSFERPLGSTGIGMSFANPLSELPMGWHTLYGVPFRVEGHFTALEHFTCEDSQQP